MEKCHFAIIGHGYMAQRYIKCIENNPRSDLKFVASRGRIVRDHVSGIAGGPRANEDELCSFLGNHDDIHAVIICSPDHTHVGYVSRLLASGKVILCEKPLARTEEEFQTLLQLSNTCRSDNLAVGMNCRFRSKILHLKGLIEAGALGRLKFVNASYYSNIIPILDGEMKTWWLEYPRGTMPFLHGGAIHLFDALRFLLGDVKKVMCIPVSTSVSRDIGGDSFMVIMNFATEVIASVAITGTSPGPNRFQITIESDRCAVDENNRYIRGAGADSSECTALPVDDFKDLDRQLAHLIDIADGRATPINTIGEAYKNFAVIRACEKSVISHSWVSVNAEMDDGEMNHG